ncbi:hypothetical protein F5X68DRAFT_204651 [Plectosphaerella plurivora]|uniref:Uncharacterized protein n=1 Tax=Plectosphaerella plurivora TaxID=936078 RepID=A0A9P8VFP5_9PEZI|nr:hypothetical protein F5X68DRAFT_204651 [Plectosphaerella plurivora]
MDGTYQNPYNRAHIDSPLSPDTPQSASYRANVNRTKTRKWVEAKTQNYDGDDWGGDDYGDEPAPVPAIPPLQPSGSRQASYASGRLPSEPPMPAFVPQQQQQQQQPPAERTRDSGPPPALHIHTQPQSPPVAPAETNPYAAGPDRDTERRSSPQPVHNDLPSRASDRSTPPLSQEPAAAYYAAYDQAQAAQPNVANTSQSGAFDAAPAPNLQETIASGRDAHGPRDAPAQPQHLLQEHPQPQSSADPNLTSDAPSPQLEGRPARDLDDQTGHVAQPPQFAGYPDSSQIEETKRFSTSPQLPDLARMSMFGDDLFSGSSATRFSTDAPPVPALPEKSIPEEPTAQQLPQRDQSTSPAVTGDAEAQSSAKSIDASPELPTSNMTSVAPQTRASPLPSPSPSPQPAAEPDLAPPKPFRPSLPGNWVSETVTPFEQGSYTDRDPSVNEGSQKALAASSKDTDSDADVGRSASPAVPIASSSPETVHPSASSPKDAAPAVHPVSTVQDDFAPPEVLHRENTLNSIASPSPIKESDKLREEIIRTLSPVRPTHEPTTTSKAEDPSEFDPPTRESTYLHGVYDDYWTGGDDKQTNETLAAVPEQRSPPAVVEPLPEIQPLSPRSPLRDVSTDRDYPSIDSRPKRFSWEGGADDSGEDSDKETAPATTKVQPVPVVDVGLAKPAETPSSVSVSEPEAESSVRGGSDLPSRLAETARLNSQDDASQISHQVSQVSSLPRGEDRTSFVAPQPPSPVSVASEATPSAEPKSLSMLDDRALGLSTDPTPPPKLVTDDERQGPDASTFPPSPPSPQVPLKIMSFREILELPNAADRISKYDETRQQFAQMDSGLNNWLVNVKAQHPDHANASPMFHGGQVVMPGTPHGLDQASQQVGAGGGGAAPTQQPYYQQYLNASSPTTSSTPGRPLTGTLGGGSHSSTSDFKHSSGQVGAKGKGLLLAAGKAGKGLLSKGKDKLRRDKVFP